MNTLAQIRAGVERCPDSVLVLNADDPLTASLALNVPNQTVWYGLEKTVGTQGKIDLSDADVCPKCQRTYTYDYHTYAHLGGYRCVNCGYARPAADVGVTSIDHIGTDGSVIHLRVGKKTQEVNVSLPAVYNIYNAAAAVGAAIAMKVSPQKAMDSLASLHSSFGRLETFTLGGNRLQMILVKNPAGCNQAFSYVTGFSEDYTAVLCLNNRTGDGHDFSWINDTDYEKLCQDPHLKKIYVGGDRADDLMQRLLQAGASEEIMEKVTDYRVLVNRLKEEDRPAFLLPNYTSMMELRAVLSQETGTKDFWE